MSKYKYIIGKIGDFDFKSDEALAIGVECSKRIHNSRESGFSAKVINWALKNLVSENTTGNTFNENGVFMKIVDDKHTALKTERTVMSKYIDGEVLDNFQMDVTFSEHHTFEAVENLIACLIGPEDKTSGGDMMNAMVDIVSSTKEIMKKYGVRVCAPHYTIEDGKYLPCYNMDTRCEYCTKKKSE